MRGYDTVEYAKSRLIETMIMHNKEPFMVNSVGGSNTAITIGGWYPRKSEEMVIVPFDECDINPVKIGYVNYKGDSQYVMRTPMRKCWRQGLRMLNMVTSEGENPRGIPMKVIAESIVGSYPKVASCIEKLSTSRSTKRIAFCRDFSLNREFDLTYKGVVDVGKVNAENGNIILTPNMSWVNEALNESMETT